MAKTFKEFVSEIATDTSENAKFSAEDIQSVVDEFNSKDSEIERLKGELDKKNQEHEELKNRIVEKLFSNPKGKPDEEEDNKEKEEEPEIKSFNDLVKPDYRIRNQ